MKWLFEQYHDEMVGLLEQRTDQGDTPLFLAASYPKVDCLMMLIEHGADVAAIGEKRAHSTM